MDLETFTLSEKLKGARSTSTPVDLLRELAKDANWGVKQNVAENPSTPEDLLRELAKDVNFVVRRYVAENPSTPVDLLEEFAKNEISYIRSCVAKHPKSSSKMLIVLFEHEKSLNTPAVSVIKALYNNKKLPYIAKVIIENLFGDML